MRSVSGVRGRTAFRRRELLAAVPGGPAALALCRSRLAAADGIEDGRLVPMRDIAFTDGDDRLRHLSKLPAHPVLLHFWASCCGPCIREPPAMVRFAADTAADGILVVPINVDKEDPHAVRTFLADHDASGLPPCVDRNRMLLHMIGFSEIPTTLVLDRRHRLVASVTGPVDWTDPSAQAAVRSLLF